MEENKDDYLKKKLHIKDRFIKRLESEKRQLEIDNNSLKQRLGLVECRLNSLARNRRKAICEGLQNIKHDPTPTQESLRINVEPPSVAGSMLSRYIPFPNSCSSNIEVAHDMHERIPMPPVNVGQDVKKDQLLNENLEYTLEISYLKARLKSSDTARTAAERKIESLEEKVRQLEKSYGGEMSRNVENDGQDGSRPVPMTTSAPIKNNEVNHPSSDVATAPSKMAAKKDSTVVYSTLMTCLNSILQTVISLDEKMNHIQKDWQRHPLGKSS